MQNIPSNLNDLLMRVERLLAVGQNGDALEIIRSSRIDAPDARNAAGVVLMRLGRATEAIDVFRKLTTNDTGLFLKKDTPTIYGVNYATALILDGNVNGAIVVLNEIKDAGHPGVVRLRSAITRWRKSLPWLQRLWMDLSGCRAKAPVTLDGLPGELIPQSTRRSAQTAA